MSTEVVLALRTSFGPRVPVCMLDEAVEAVPIRVHVECLAVGRRHNGNHRHNHEEQ
jgi:hypothetical protein